ncbi:Carboxypeptidase regulatory-like domain-containing protein [Asanoa hainanensis]|uniref:Carboxypeptidase regulatory-like domain-containing protein n=1 Tax=Asanoa hainanensis TaxID=560556 RepID=A0A239MTY7_9ACTN|nr:carboxypeptidase-like regulatory domain-containing protein [Asanoa hainanensis]SNT46115.1 Carboxypeptidase regulatory-like domain-containing protein [Asanoa hainanensis]
MRSIRRRTTAAIAAAVLAGTIGAWATPAQAAANGSISGHLKTAAGAPAGDVLVQAYDAESWASLAFTSTGADGSYQLDGLASGQYIVSFGGFDIPEQFFDQKTDIFDADPVTVTAGQTTVVDQDLFATGSLVGRITDGSGAPLETFVRVYRADNEELAGSHGTDSDGTFRIAVPTGTYVVTFEPVANLYQEQYVPGKLTHAEAQRFVVGAGQDVAVNDTALTVGSLSGRVTRSDGTPAANVHLNVSAFNGDRGAESANTNSNGEFTVPKLLDGNYEIEFWVGNRTEYFDRTADPEEADPVRVRGGQDNRITPSLLPTGSVRIRAVDAVSGVLIKDICAEGQCSNGTGQLVLTGLVEGRQSIYIQAESNHLSRSSDVTVRAGQTTDILVRLMPGAGITTTVVDKATGAPLPNVCLTPFKPSDFHLPEGQGGNCSDSAGKVTLKWLEAGTYRLYAKPLDKSYGRQWVGATGGTGDERQAATITVKASKTTTAPQVRIDRAGTIRGRVTDAATGAALSNVGVGPTTWGRSRGPEATTDAAGNYQIDGFGPYRWPLYVSDADGYASVWTGGAVTRFASTGTQVTSGAVAVADFAMTRGVAVRGTVTTNHGTPDWAWIRVLNTETGDYAGNLDFNGGAYELRVLPGQELRFGIRLTIGDNGYDFDNIALPPATPGGQPRHTVTVPASGLTLDLTIPLP